LCITPRWLASARSVIRELKEIVRDKPEDYGAAPRDGEL
jgi:hypothetical protein